MENAAGPDYRPDARVWPGRLAGLRQALRLRSSRLLRDGGRLSAASGLLYRVEDAQVLQAVARAHHRLRRAAYNRAEIFELPGRRRISGAWWETPASPEFRRRCNSLRRDRRRRLNPPRSSVPSFAAQLRCRTT